MDISYHILLFKVVSFFSSVAKDLANCLTDMCLLYSKATYRPRKDFNYFWGGYLHPPKRNRP